MPFSVWAFENLEECLGLMNKGRSRIPTPPVPIGCLLPFYAFTKIKVIHMKKTWSILNQGDPGYISDNIHISSVCLAFPLCQRHNHLTSGEHPTKAIRSLKQKQEQAESLNPVTSVRHLWVSPFYIFCRSWCSKWTLALLHPTNGLIYTHAMNQCFIHQKAGWNQLVVDFRQ